MGLDCGLEGGLICLFDIPGSRVVRAISVPQKVTAIAVVASSGGPAVPAHLHPALLYFHGIAAVGTAEGRLLLVDLATEETGETSDQAPATLSYIQVYRFWQIFCNTDNKNMTILADFLI